MRSRVTHGMRVRHFATSTVSRQLRACVKGFLVFIREVDVRIGRSCPTQLVMSVPSNGGGGRGDLDQLNGWKEIAAYIGKGVRQAQRWEKLGMPIHRVAGLDGVVYAHTSEIDAWRTSSAGRDAASLASGAPADEPDIGPARLADSVPDASEVPRADGARATFRLVRPTRLMVGACSVAVVVLGFGGYRYLARAPLAVVLHSPADADQGGSFRFTASGGESDLRSAYRLMRNPSGGAHLVTPPVARGADGLFLWVFSTDCQTPPGRHEVALANGAGVALTRRVGVTIRENPACQGATPDLYAESISLATDQVVAGDTLQCRFLLRNQGAAPANPSTSRLRLSRSAIRSSVGDIPLIDVSSPALRPGQEATLEPAVTIPPATEPGLYYVWVVADNQSDNVESYTHNNYVRSAPLVVLPRTR